MSDSEEDAGGFGSEEEEDAGGFGDASDEDEESEDETAGGDGFGDASDDESEDGGFGDAEEEDAEEAAPASTRNAAGAWAAYAKVNLNEGAKDCYEHPGLDGVFDKCISKCPGPMDQVQGPPLYKLLMTFMGDLEPTAKTQMRAMEMIVKLCSPGMKSEILAKELYMQILKQLYENKSRMSHARGFILLNMYLGSFPPPSGMITAIVDIIELGPPSFRQYSQDRLAASANKKPRLTPPLRPELLAVKKKSPLELCIITPDGVAVNVPVSSVITGAEIIELVAKAAGLKSAEGWGTRIKSGKSFISTGNGAAYVLDQISALEQVNGLGSWRFGLAKEAFGAWHPDITDDARGLEIVSKQIFGAMREGRFKFKTKEEYIDLAVHGYYIAEGSNVLSGAELEELLLTLLPKRMVIDTKKGAKKAKGAKKIEQWAEIVEKSHAKTECVKRNMPLHVVQYQVIEKIRKLWPNFFAVEFDAVQVDGPDVCAGDLALSVNETGIYISKLGSADIVKGFPHDEIDKYEVDVSGNFCFITAIIEGYRAQAQSYSFKVVHGSDLDSLLKICVRHKSSTK